MKKRRMMRTLLVLMLMLTACADQPEEQKLQMEEKTAHEPEKEQRSEKEPLYEVVRYPMDIQGYYAVNEKDIYFCANQSVYAVDRESDAMRLIGELAENQKQEEAETVREEFDMRHQLYMDSFYLYYLTEDGKEVWKIDTRNGEKEKLEISGDIYSIYPVQHQLYCWSYDENMELIHQTYALEEDGKIGKLLTGTEADLYQTMPEGYTEPYLGTFLHYIYQISHYEKVLLNDSESELVLYDIETGEVSSLQEEAVAYYDGAHLISYDNRYSTEDGKDHCYYLNTETGEQTELKQIISTVLGAEKQGVYYVARSTEEELEPMQEEICYLSFDEMTKEGSEEHVMTLEKSGCLKNNLSYFNESFLTLDKGSIYAVQDEAYELRMTHIGWENEKTLQKDCGLLMRSDKEGVGKTTYVTNTEDCPNCGKQVLSYYLEGFLLDEKKPGDAEINESVHTYLEEVEQEANQIFEEAECEAHDFITATCNYRELTNEVTIQNENFIGYLWFGYDYWRGAAHGMPYRVFRLYDRNTGEELFIDDILETSETELNARIISEFEQQEESEELALDYIKENAGFYDDHNFRAGSYYLNEEGLVYYFDAYEVACYAAGMPQVVIPYEELSWKVNWYE